MHFQLASVKGTKYDGEAYEVLVPTRAGVIGIFEDHMPLISAAQPGVLSVRRKATDPNSSMEHFAINGGVVEVKGSSVNFIADDVTTADEISEQQATAAQERAKELIKGADTQVALQEADRMLAHSSAQLQVAKLKRHHHN